MSEGGWVNFFSWLQMPHSWNQSVFGWSRKGEDGDFTQGRACHGVGLWASGHWYACIERA